MQVSSGWRVRRFIVVLGFVAPLVVVMVWNRPSPDSVPAVTPPDHDPVEAPAEAVLFSAFSASKANTTRTGLSVSAVVAASRKHDRFQPTHVVSAGTRETLPVLEELSGVVNPARRPGPLTGRRLLQAPHRSSRRRRACWRPFCSPGPRRFRWPRRSPPSSSLRKMLRFPPISRTCSDELDVPTVVVKRVAAEVR